MAVIMTNDEITTNIVPGAFAPHLSWGEGKAIEWVVSCGGHIVNGSLPWHVPATILDGTRALCVSPPMAPDATTVGASDNASFIPVGVELTLNGQTADLTHSGPSFQCTAPTRAFES